MPRGGAFVEVIAPIVVAGRRASHDRRRQIDAPGHDHLQRLQQGVVARALADEAHRAEVDRPHHVRPAVGRRQDDDRNRREGSAKFGEKSESIVIAQLEIEQGEVEVGLGGQSLACKERARRACDADILRKTSHDNFQSRENQGMIIDQQHVHLLLPLERLSDRDHYRPMFAQFKQNQSSIALRLTVTKLQMARDPVLNDPSDAPRGEPFPVAGGVLRARPDGTARIAQVPAVRLARGRHRPVLRPGSSADERHVALVAGRPRAGGEPCSAKVLPILSAWACRKAPCRR